MPTSREIDENGFLLVKGCPISSFGIFDYGAGQLGLPGDPNRIVKVFRPESAVNDPAAIDSFKNVPFIIDHTMLSGFYDDQDAAAPEEKGLDGVLTSNVYYQAPWMLGDLKIFSRKAQKFLAKGKKDLSLGYSCDFELTPGVWNGQPYEVVQTNMRGNHIALVDEGRVPGARVLDGLCFDHLSFTAVQPSEKDENMAIKGKGKKAMDNAVAQLKALLPALEAYLNEEGAEPAHQGNPSPGEAGGGAAGGKDADPNPMAAAGGTGEPSSQGATPPAGQSTHQAAPTEAGGGATSPEGGDPAGHDPAASATGSTASATPPPSGSGGEGEGAAGGDVNGLISQVEGVLAQIKAAVAGTTGGTGADEEMNENVEDTVTGLQGTRTGEGSAVCADEEGSGGGIGAGQGKASAGPSAGLHAEAGDAALRNFYADSALKDRVYNRVSKVVGAFDCKAMDARAVIAYGVKHPKINIKCAKGTEYIALDAYLTGVETAAKATKTRIQSAVAGDSAVKSDEMDAWLNGGK
jgi:uncharacterized protein